MQFHISSPITQGSQYLLNVCNQPPDIPLPSQHPNDEQSEQQNKDIKKCQNIQQQTKTNNVTISNMNTNLQNTHNIASSTLLPMYQNKKYQEKAIQYQQLNRTITKLYGQNRNKPASSFKASGIKRLPLRNSTKHNITNTRDKLIYTECGRINGNQFYKGPNICSIKQQKTQNKPIQIQTTEKSLQPKLKSNTQKIRKVKIEKQQNVINKWIKIYDRVYKRLHIYKNNKLNICKQNQKQKEKQKQKYKIEKQQLKEYFLKHQINMEGEFSVQYLIELLIVKRILLENPIINSDAASRIDWSSKLFKISKLIRWFSNIFKKPAKIKESNINSSYKFVYPQNHHCSEYKMPHKTEKDIRRSIKLISVIKQKRHQLSPPQRNISYKNYSLNQNISINNYKYDEKNKYKYYQYFKNQVFENLCQTFFKAKRSNRDSQASLNQGKEKDSRQLFETNNKISFKSLVSDKESRVFKKCESLSQSSSSKSQMQFDLIKIQKQLIGLKKLVKKTLSTMSIHIGQDKQKIEKKLKRQSLANYFNYKKLSKSVGQSLHKDIQKNIKKDNSYSNYLLNPMKVEFQRQRQLKKKRPKNFLKKRNGKYAIVIDKINKNKLIAKIKNKKQGFYQNSLPIQLQPKLVSKNSLEQQSQQQQSFESSTVKIQLQQEPVNKLQEIYLKSSKRIKNAQTQSLIEDHKLTDEQIQKIISNAHHLIPGQNQDQSNISMLKMRRKYKKLMFSNKIKDKTAQNDTGEQIQGIRKSHRKKVNNTIIGQSNQLTVDSYEKHSFSGFGKQKKNLGNDQRKNNSQQKTKSKLRNKQFNSILKSYQTEEHQAQVQKRENLLNQFYINQALESTKKISNISHISNIKNTENQDEKQQKKPQKQLRETFLKEKLKKQQLEHKIQSMKSEFQWMLKNKIQIDGPSVFCQIVRKKNNRLLSQYQSQLQEMARLRRPCYLNSGQSKIERNIDGKFQFQQDTVQMNFLKKFVNQFGLLGQKSLENKKSYKNNLFF